MSDVVVRNGLVVGSGGTQRADLQITGGVITALGRDVGGSRATVEVDGTGCWIGPGLVDIHTHLREPGGEHKEDIASGSAAAAAGGYTAVVAMPNTTPPIDNAEVARFVIERGKQTGLVDVVPAGTLTEGRRGRLPAPYRELWGAGVRLFTDDGDTVADDDVLREAMIEISRLGGVIGQHAVDPVLSAGGHLHEGERAATLGITGIPAESETAIVARDLELVRSTGAAYHLQHVSSAAGVDLIRAAKADGLAVTAEVTPHHLAFHEHDVGEADSNFKMMPPLRTAADRGALRTALASGDIDVVATDHAPHAADEKLAPFEEAPFGVVGLEQAAAVVNTVAELEPISFFDRLSVGPARIAQLDGHGRWPAVGSPANLVVFDPVSLRRSGPSFSRSGNDPYAGREWRGDVRLTVLRGRVTFNGIGVAAS